MGVLNANDDSFFSQSRFSEKDAVIKIEKMIEEGADIIDIGAVSSRPGSKGVSSAEELRRLQPIIDTLYTQKLYEQVELSLDSYTPSAIEYALNRGFKIINDITGLENDEVCRLIGEYSAQAVIMHMKGSPETMQHNPSYSNILQEMDAFFQERIEKADAYKIRDVSLDVGIGFGKRLQDNVELLKKLSHFKHFNKPLLIGASRKSMIDMISPSSPEERLPGTLAIHLKAYENGASIIRVHDVKEHVQALRVYQSLL